MNDIVWLVQTNGINSSHVQKVWDAASKYASVDEVIVRPFAEELDTCPDLTGKTVIPYGSVRLAKIGRNYEWSGNYYNDDLFNSITWMKNRDDMLNSNSINFPITKLTECDKILKMLENNGRVFIRPCEDHKAFTGFVASLDDIVKLTESVTSENHTYDRNLVVAVNPVITIYEEYRFFIGGGKVISGSTYAINNGRPFSMRVTDTEILTIADEKASAWLPHDVCTMDLAKTPDGYKVVEFNSFNSSGFYDHDVDLIVKKVTEWEKDRNE